jgi:hypothetical protein
MDLDIKATSVFIWVENLGFNMRKFTMKHKRNLRKSYLGQIPANKIILPKKELIKMYINDNITSIQIGNKFNCSHKTVLRNLKEYGIKINNISKGTKNGMDNHAVHNQISKAHKGKRCSKNTEFKTGRKETTKGRKFAKHHIYLRENSTQTMKIPYNKHIKLHYQAYRYLVEIGLIEKYIKWFDKKYGLK